MSKVKYIFNFIKVLSWPFFIEIGQLFLIVVASVIFTSINASNLNISINEYTKRSTYEKDLSNFMNSYMFIFLIIFSIIIIYFLIKKYNKINKDYKNEIKNNIFYIITLSFSLVIFLNIIIIYLNNLFNIKDTNKFNFFFILTTGILGPIMEEYLFRGIVYEKLKQFNSKKTAIILSILIFGLLHGNIINIIYALIIGSVLMFLYEKYKTIKIPIIFHIVGNTSIVILMPIIMKLNNYLNISILIISLILSLYSFKKLKIWR